MSGAAAGVGVLSAQVGKVAAKGVASARAESKSKLRNFMRQSPDKGRLQGGAAQRRQMRLPQASKAGFPKSETTLPSLQIYTGQVSRSCGWGVRHLP
jgi:hypothetical protein